MKPGKITRAGKELKLDGVRMADAANECAAEFIQEALEDQLREPRSCTMAQFGAVLGTLLIGTFGGAFGWWMAAASGGACG